MKILYGEKEMLMASNKSLAEYNLNQEEPLRQARVRLHEKQREARRAAEQVRKLKTTMEEKLAASGSGSGKSQNEPDIMLALLQVSYYPVLLKLVSW